MVKGKEDPVYRKLLKSYAELDPDFKYILEEVVEDAASFIPLIITEGKTDWKHLKAALKKLKDQGYFKGLDVQFKEYEDEIQMGDESLLKTCDAISKIKQQQPIICIFDRDNTKVIKKISGQDGKAYKDWGNNVFSFALPVPDHRQDNPDISIEFYYKDSEIKQSDSEGRRLYIGNEFDQKSTWHISEELVCKDRNKIGKSNSIIDDGVFGKDKKNIALPKNLFAKSILDEESEFKDFDVSEFNKVFTIIEEIISLRR